MGNGCSLSGISLNHHSGISVIIPASQSGFMEWKKSIKVFQAKLKT